MLANYRWFGLADLEAFTHCDSWTQVEECDLFFLLGSDNCLFTASADFWSLKGKTTRWTAFSLVDNWACTPVFSKVINKKFYLKSKKNTISAKKKKGLRYGISQRCMEFAVLVVFPFPHVSYHLWPSPSISRLYDNGAWVPGLPAQTFFWIFNC